MISLLPVRGLPEIAEGDDLAAMIVERIGLEEHDVVVVAQKAVSKVEGRVVRIDSFEASPKAIELAGNERDPREVEAILREAKRIVRERGSLVIAETRHGFVCASAGVDHSNAPEPGTLVLLPVDPDASARELRTRFRELTGLVVGVVVTDSFGRPFRKGTTDVAIGVAGIPSFLDLVGTVDRAGYELRATLDRGRRRDRRRRRSGPQQGRRRAGGGRARPPARGRRQRLGARDRARARPVFLTETSTASSQAPSQVRGITTAGPLPSRGHGRVRRPQPRPADTSGTPFDVCRSGPEEDNSSCAISSWPAWQGS